MSGSFSQLSSRDFAAVLLVILLWGLNFIPTLYALDSFTPFQLGAARFLLVAFPMILLVPRPGIPAKWLLFYGFTQGVGQFGFLFFALKFGMTAALASVLMQTQIFFTALLGVTLLGEVIPRSLKIGMAIAAAGLLCFAINVCLAGGSGGVTMAGFLLTLLAASMWAGSNVVVKKIQASGPSQSPLSLIVWSSLLSGISFVVLSLLFDEPSARWNWLSANAMGWVSLLYLGWIAGGLAFWLWTLLLTRHPASRVAPFSLGIPVVGMLSGIVILDEKVTALQWAGSLLVMSAVVFVVARSLYSVERMKRLYKRQTLRDGGRVIR